MLMNYKLDNHQTLYMKLWNTFNGKFSVQQEAMKDGFSVTA